MVDCSKTIWIIATNALDDKIVQYCAMNKDIFVDDEDEEYDGEKREELLEELTETMKQEFITQFKVIHIHLALSRSHTDVTRNSLH
jgi:ATP-dependent Clp protease ATP-binding subunit ClpA